MNTVTKVIITTIVILAAIVAGWWLITSLISDTGNYSSYEMDGQNDTREPDETQAPVATITYSGTNFTPETVTVQAGEAVEIVNDSGNVLYFASDEHPTHLDNSELNIGEIEPGSSATFTVTSPGMWGFHDHYNAAASGEIIVE